jgi:hypothetical protein
MGASYDGRGDQPQYSRYLVAPMWSTIPATVIVLVQTAQPGADSKSHKWCFEREQQGAQLCEETEDACNKLRSINAEIARSPCRRVEPPEIQISPTERPAPPNPEKNRPQHNDRYEPRSSLPRARFIRASVAKHDQPWIGIP